MDKKILFILSFSFLIAQIWAFDGNTNSSKNMTNEPSLNQNSTNNDNAKKLAIQKLGIAQKIVEAVQSAQCLIDSVSGKKDLFPLNANQKNSLASIFSSKSKNQVITDQYVYNGMISDLNKNLKNTQEEAEKILQTWPKDKNSPADLKNLEVKVSEGLRAASSFIINGVNPIADAIYDHSLPLVRKKIDPKAQCKIK